MKGRILSVGLLLLAVAPLWAQSLSFGEADADVLVEVPEKNTGLDEIYVFRSFANVDASIPYIGTPPRWYRYSNLGGGFAEEITAGVSNSGGTSTLSGIAADMGYIVDFGDSRRYFYIIDYSRHPLKLTSVSPAPEQDCTSTVLHLEGEGSPLIYYTINGQQRSLDRQIQVKYDTQDWDEGAQQFTTVPAVKELPNFTSQVMISPPAYCSTFFTVEGDKYLSAWGQPQSVETAVVSPTAVEARAFATQVGREDDEKGDGDGDSDAPAPDGSNEIGSSGDGLGGSAPAEISFRAFCTEGVLHDEWQMASDPEFENITYRFNERNLDYTFRDEGVVYVRYIGSNADGSCEYFSDVFTVSIGASELRCPNAFSPGASEGINDEWKVSFRSLVDFKCWIFDRYGTQLFYFDDPHMGWDGRYKGKLVKPGVYYYVIQATGSEGKKYKKSGDINIIRFKSFSNSSGGSATPTE